MTAILTNIGLSKFRNVKPLNKVNITSFAIGDGSQTMLDPESKGLVHEVWRGSASLPIRDPEDKSILIFETFTEPRITGFVIREMGLFDEEGDLIAIGFATEKEQRRSHPEQAVGQILRMHINLDDTEQADKVYSSCLGCMDHGALYNRDAVDAHSELIGKLDDIRSFSNVDPAKLVDGQGFYLMEVQPGTGRGGGAFKWSSTTPKSLHDGITVISGTVPPRTGLPYWNGSVIVNPASNNRLEDFLNGVGETDPTGTGCFIRLVGEAISFTMAGALENDGANVYGNSAPVEAALNWKSYSTVYADIDRAHLERTVQLNTRGVTIRGARSGFDTLTTIDVMFNVDVPGVSAQLNFYNLFFRNFPEDGSSGAGTTAIRCIDSPLIDSTMDSCWFAMNVNSTKCIEGRFFFFKISNTIMELGHRAIVTSGGTESNGLHITNSAFYKMRDCAFDFSDTGQKKRNFVISNIVTTLGEGTSQGALIRGNRLMCNMSNIMAYSTNEKQYNNTRVLKFVNDCNILIDNIRLASDLEERNSDATLVSWFDVADSRLSVVNSYVFAPHNTHIKVGGTSAVNFSHTEFVGSNNRSIEIASNTTGSRIEFDHCEFKRDRNQFVLAGTSLSNNMLVLSDTHINDCSYGDGSGSNSQTNLTAPAGLTVQVNRGKFTKKDSNVAYHVDASDPITVRDYEIAGSRPLFNSGVADFSVFAVFNRPSAPVQGYTINGLQVIGEREAPIPDAGGGTEVATINAILAAMRNHGLIAT